MRTLIKVTLAALILSGTWQAASAHDPAEHGFNLVVFDKPFSAPAFALDNLAGGDTKLADYSGKYVLLNFWATWCPPCLEEMPSLDTLHSHFAERGFSVLAISSDKEGAAIVSEFVTKLGVSFPILLDPDQGVSNAYGAKNLPVSFLLNPAGEVIAAAQGERDWASEAALSTLDEIIAP